MPGMAARMVWNADDRLIAMIASHFSIGKSSIWRDVLDAGVVDQHVERAEVPFRPIVIMAAISAGLVMSAAE